MLINKYDTEKSYEYENGYYLTSGINRYGKFLAHYELYKRISDLPGDIVELGVFKGCSFVRFAAFRDLLENPLSRKIIGFDMWGEFPQTQFEQDKSVRQRFIDTAGDGLTIHEFQSCLKYRGIINTELVKGDICITLPEYVDKHPELRISLIHIDTDIYEPAKVALECLWDRLVKNGVLILDDYGIFPGETQAVDEFFADKQYLFQKLRISHNCPTYIIKK